MEIVESFKNGDYTLAAGIPGVAKLSDEDAGLIKGNIRNYGARLVSLPDLAWETSACIWMRNYWDCIVDLYTEDEGQSDLVLAVRVYESSDLYEFRVHSVYVP